MRTLTPNSIGNKKVRPLSAQYNRCIEKIFSSSCQLALSKKEEMQRFIEEQVREAES
jgi:hypothetical protein